MVKIKYFKIASIKASAKLINTDVTDNICRHIIQSSPLGILYQNHVFKFFTCQL